MVSNLVSLEPSSAYCVKADESVSLEAEGSPDQFDQGAVPLASTSAVPNPVSSMSCKFKSRLISIKDDKHFKCAEAKNRVAAIDKRIEQAMKDLDKALKSGVKITKKTFFTKIVFLAVSVGGLVAAAIATGATGGIAAPFLVLALGNVAISAGDAFCAYQSAYNHKRYSCGTDSVGNFMFWLQGKMFSRQSSDAKYLWAESMSLTMRGLCLYTNPLIIGSSDLMMHTANSLTQQARNEAKITFEELSLQQDLAYLLERKIDELQVIVEATTQKIKQYRAKNDKLVNERLKRLQAYRNSLVC